MPEGIQRIQNTLVPFGSRANPGGGNGGRAVVNLFDNLLDLTGGMKKGLTNAVCFVF